MVITNNVRSIPLPKDLFLVRVPMIATYTETELSLLGMPVNVINGRVDNTTYNTMSVVMLPLDKIINIYISGYPIRILNESDLETIYTLLDEYVRGVAKFGEARLNADTVVEERLFEIERFASEIFDTNKAAILKQSIQFANGYDIDFGTMNVTSEPREYSTYGTPNYTHIDSGHMSGYSTMLDSIPFGNNQMNNSNQPSPREDSVRERFKTNPNKKELSTSTYINNNLPNIDFDKIVRNKNTIRIHRS